MVWYAFQMNDERSKYHGVGGPFRAGCVGPDCSGAAALLHELGRRLGDADLMVLLTGVVIWRVLVTPPEDVLDDEPFHQGGGLARVGVHGGGEDVGGRVAALEGRTASSTERVLARPSPSVVS